MISVRGKKVLSSEGRVLRVKTVGSWQLAVGSWRSAMKFGFGVWGMAAATCDTFFGAWFAGKLQDLRFVNVDLGCTGVTYLL